MKYLVNLDLQPRKASIRDAPALKNAFTKLGGIMAVALLASLGITAYLHWRSYKRASVAAATLESRGLPVAKEVIESRLARVISLANTIAARSTFTSPEDGNRDNHRFVNLSPAGAEQLMQQQSIPGYLSDESSGTLVNSGTEITSAFPLWHVTRGLPQATRAGQSLANHRRALAETELSRNPDLLQIAELDGDGRVVFLMPYRRQINLRQFNFSAVFQSINNPSLNIKAPMLIAHQDVSIPSAGTMVTSVVVPIARADARRYLWILVRPQTIAAAPASAATEHFAILDATGRGVYFSDDLSVEILRRSRKNRPIPQSLAQPFLPHLVSLPVRLADSSYTLVFFFDASPIPYAILRSFLYITGAQLLCFVINLAVLRAVVRWVARLENALDDVRTRVNDKIQDLAHDYRTPIQSLRNVMSSVVHNVSREVVFRFGTAITDLVSYTEQLSEELVPSVFSVEGVPGVTTYQSKNNVSTYVPALAEIMKDTFSAQLKGKFVVEYLNPPADAGIFAHITFSALTRILQNLLANATEACKTQKNPSITLQIEESVNSIYMRVIDNGCGIREADRERVFDPDFTTKREKQHGKGLPNTRK